MTLSTTTDDLLKRPEVLQAFRDGWALADDLGLEGERVAHGLSTALDALEGTKPVGRYAVVDADALRQIVSLALPAVKSIMQPVMDAMRKAGLLDGTKL
jgi:hypothetical protein